jgi:hypothetical protein
MVKVSSEDKLSNVEFGKHILTSLPPLEQSDWNTTIANLKKLNCFDDSLLQEYNDRACVTFGETGSSQMESIRSRLQAHRSQMYKEKMETLQHRMTVAEDQNKQTIYVRTFAEQLDTMNCRAGYWSAEWMIRIRSETACEISGRVRLHSYYYENVNVQMRANREFPVKEILTAEEKVNSMVAKFEKEKMSYEDQLAKCTVDHIVALELELYEDLQRMCDECDDNLKKIRRILPITKTKFKWDAAAQKNVKLLNDESTGVKASPIK